MQAGAVQPGELRAGSVRPSDETAKAGEDSAARNLSGRDRFLKACRCEPLERPPVWLMRQAGRVLPEYRALKERYSFLELIQTPTLAAEVTLQPIRRFNFDAAIIFSDILVLAEGLGQAYRFTDGAGVKMEWTIEYASHIDRLDPRAVTERLEYVAAALRLVKAELAGRTALIGFAGSPWTLANFMLEGGSAAEFTKARILFAESPRVYGRLAEKLAIGAAEFLKLQLEAGADAVQLFDTLAAVADASTFAEVSARWMRDIIAELRGRAPVIVFAKGVNDQWPVLVQTGATVLGVDWTVRLRDVADQLPAGIAVQGNLDPSLLKGEAGVVRRETRRILQDMRDRPGHIFNLGHGVPPEAKLECIQALVETVRERQ